MVEAQKALFNTFFTYDFSSMNDSGNFDLSAESIETETLAQNDHRLLAKTALDLLEFNLDSEVRLKFYDGFMRFRLTELVSLRSRTTN